MYTVYDLFTEKMFMTTSSAYLTRINNDANKTVLKLNIKNHVVFKSP